MHKVFGIQEVTESRSKKADVRMKVLDSDILGCSGHQLMSSWYMHSSAGFKSCLLPNNQVNDFLFAYQRFYNTSIFTTHSSIQGAFPERQQMDWSLDFESSFALISLSSLMQDTIPLWTSISLLSSVDFRM